MLSLLPMIRSKTKHAFTLIEVLVSLAIIGISLGPIYFAQGTIFKRIVNSIAAVERMFLAYNFFVAKQHDKEIGDKLITHTVDDPKTEINYQKTPAPQESVLSKACNHLFVHKTVWKWQDMDVSHQNLFISITFNPPPKKEEKEQPQKEEQQQVKKEPAKTATPGAPNDKK